MIKNLQLEDAGYRWFKGGPYSVIYPNADYFYQKAIDDERGTRYFIQMVHYAPIHFSNGLSVEESWMCNVNYNDPQVTFDQHRVTDLVLAEALCEDFWVMMGRPYYDR